MALEKNKGPRYRLTSKYYGVSDIRGFPYGYQSDALHNIAVKETGDKPSWNKSYQAVFDALKGETFGP